MPLRSLLDRSAPPLPEAQRQLEALRAQIRDLGIAGAFAALGIAISAAFVPPLAIAFAAGLAATMALALRAESRRRELLRALMRERDAYELPLVAERARRFATPARRRRLAAWLRRVVLVADGDRRPRAYNVRPLDERVRPRRERLLTLAGALEADRAVHPASVAVLHQLLTRPGTSPLYNPGLDDELVDLALHRIEAGIEQAP